MTAMGGCLYQIQDGEREVIAYASKKFTEQQRRSGSTLEKEVASLLWNIDEKFRPYLEYETFDVYTDNYALSWLKNLKNPNGKLARLPYRLQQSFVCFHKKGSENTVPDFLSRMDFSDESEVIDCNGVQAESASIHQPVTFMLEQIRDDWYFKFRDTVMRNPVL